MKRPKGKMVFVFIIIFAGWVMILARAQAEEAKAPGGAKAAVKIEYSAEDLRDPFQMEKIEIKEEPQGPVEPRPLPVMQVKGVVWGGSHPQAIVNNKVVGIGDTIEGVRIADISNSQVVVLFDNRKYNLSTTSTVSTKNKPQQTKKNP